MISFHLKIFLCISFCGMCFLFSVGVSQLTHKVDSDHHGIPVCTTDQLSYFGLWKHTNPHYPPFVTGNQMNSSGNKLHLTFKYEEEENHYRPNGKAFVCCGWDTRDFLDGDIVNECSNRYQVQEHYAGAIDHLIHAGGHACTCDEVQHTRRNVSLRESFEWHIMNKKELMDFQNENALSLTRTFEDVLKNSSDLIRHEGHQPVCRQLEWNATEFCTLLGSRSILFLGDSTMQQTITTIANLVTAQKPQNNCAQQLLFERHDMVGKDHPIRHFLKAYFERIDFVIISAGPHYHSIEHFNITVHEFFEEVDEFRREYILGSTGISDQENSSPKKDIRFIWKSINRAHFDCQKIVSPSILPPPIPEDKDQYQWSLFRTYDEIARNLTVDYPFFDYIDMYPLSLRPDGHPGYTAYNWAKVGGDCLHFCLPGPLDVFGTLMLHYLYNLQKTYF